MSDDVQQEHLFKLGKPVAPLRALTERQAAIYKLVCATPDGITALELGAILHAQSGRHAADAFCEWCGQDGSRTLKEKAIRTRLVRRPQGIYEPRDHADWTGKAEPVGPPSAQLDVLPGETFEDMFHGSDAA